MTLAEGRRNYVRCGASYDDALEHCRKPTEAETAERAEWVATLQVQQS